MNTLSWPEVVLITRLKRDKPGETWDANGDTLSEGDLDMLLSKL